MTRRLVLLARYGVVSVVAVVAVGVEPLIRRAVAPWKASYADKKQTQISFLQISKRFL